MSGANKKKILSINKVPNGLVSLTKDHYIESIDTFQRLQEETFNDQKLDQIIKDFPKFESVILITQNNLCDIQSKTATIKSKTRDLIKNHNLKPKEE